MRKLILLAAVLLSSQAFGAIAFVQCQKNAGSGTTLTVSISTTNGNFLVAAPREGTDNTTTWTIATNAAQSFTQPASGYASSNGGNRNDLEYLANASAVTSVTVTFSGSISTTTMTVCEFSGVSTTSPVDISPSPTLDTVTHTSLTSTAFTTTNANDAIIFACYQGGSNGGITAGAGYTLPVNSDNTRGGIEYQIVSSIQTGVTASCSWVTTQPSTGIVLAVKAQSVQKPNGSAQIL